MKINMTARKWNPWFWVGLIGVILSAAGVDPQTFVTWPALAEGLLSVLRNPVQLGAVVVAVLGVFNDPTTSGLSDSARAMTYRKPAKKDE